MTRSARFTSPTKRDPIALYILVFALMAAFAATCFPSQAAAQEDGYGATSPGQIYSSSDYASGYIGIGLDADLGTDSTQIAHILQQYPFVRVSPYGEFKIVRHPDFPEELLLADMRFPSAEENWLMALRFQYTDYLLKTPLLPISLGRLDNGSFAPTADTVLNKIRRSRKLLALQDDFEKTSATTNIEYGERVCIREENSDGGICHDEFQLSVRNDSANPKYLYVLEIDPEYNIKVLLSPIGNSATDPGETATSADENVRDKFVGCINARCYKYVTISSKDPIDVRLLSEVLPDNIGKKSAWSVSVTESRYSDFSIPAGGGGEAVGRDVSWQVQLYSTGAGTPGSFLANSTLSATPWQNYEKAHRCGGSLIAPNVVLTAAHCVAKGPFAGSAAKIKSVLKYRRVKAGTRDLRKAGYTYAIDSIVVHKSYDPRKNDHDIALIRLKGSTANLPKKVASPITLPDQVRGFTPLRQGDIINWYGWGVTREAGSRNTLMNSSGGAQRHPAVLRSGKIAVLSTPKCKARGKTYKNNVTPDMLCAVTPRGADRPVTGSHSFTCRGDSGGPIVKQKHPQYIQVGVVSWAVGCGVNDNPSVSANVHKYTNWIRKAEKAFVSGKVVRE